MVACPVPSGLKRCTAARMGGSSRSMFERDPTDRYNFEPSRLNASVRVLWPVSIPASEMISFPAPTTFMVFAS